MARWSDYTTGERIKILRGPGLTQERLAEAAGLSVATIRKAERDLGVGLPSLLRIAAALHTDVSAVLGQQEPRRAMRRDDRAMLRELSWPSTTPPLAWAPMTSRRPDRRSPRG